MRIPETEEVDRTGRSRLVRGLAVAVASLIMANGVVVAQELTGLDFGDAVEKSGAALVGLLEFDKAPKDQRVMDVVDTTTTTAESGSTSSSTPTTGTATTTPAATPGARPSTPGTSSGKPGRTQPGAPGATPAEVPAGVPATTPTVPPATAPAAAKTPQELIAPLQAFVEQERGLRFTGPVPMVTLPESQFKTRLFSYRLGAATDEARRLQGVMRALGLIPAGVDLPAQVARLSAGQATAFYDTAANEMVIRGDLEAPFTRKTLIHELATALNDQHFELDRPALRDADDERNTAFTALAEGIATRIEHRYVLGLPDSDKRSIQAEQQRLAASFPKDLPSIVLVSFGFPYTAGLRLANALADAGGPSSLDNALRQPPTTTEQVLHPDRYLSGEVARDMPAPAADGPVIRQGTMGQLDLSLMLAEGLEPGYAEDAADGWAGDRYVAWDGPGGQTCVRLSIQMDTPDDTTVMGEALADWAAEMSGAVIEGSGPFTVTRCA